MRARFLFGPSAYNSAIPAEKIKLGTSLSGTEKFASRDKFSGRDKYAGKE